MANLNDTKVWGNFEVTGDTTIAGNTMISGTATINNVITDSILSDTGTLEIGEPSNETDLIVYGNIQVETLTTHGNIRNCITVTNTYQILSTDDTIVCNKTTAFTVTLPIAIIGQLFRIKNINLGTVTLEGLNSDTIDNELNQPIQQWDCIVVQCYEANKWIII